MLLRHSGASRTQMTSLQDTALSMTVLQGTRAHDQRIGRQLSAETQSVRFGSRLGQMWEPC